MNTHNVKVRFGKFRILLYRGSSSTIVMVNMTPKLKQEETTMTTWETQAVNFTASNKLNVELCLHYFSTTDIVTYKCHVYDSAKGRYNMIMGRDLLTTLGLDPKFSDFIVVGVK